VIDSKNGCVTRHEYDYYPESTTSILKESAGEERTEAVVIKEDEPMVISNEVASLKVFGKIDTSKFERKKAEIVEDKENYYIIDTNVFVNCPDIISKIDKRYTVVLAAKVVDELDKLKITLSASDQKNVQAALRSINKQMTQRDIRMELADVSLLPRDFDRRSPDNMILTVALKYKGDNNNPILLTSDNGLMVKAMGLKITTISLKDYLHELKRY
jgi:rRNA-processing protein FCF1